MQWRTLAGTAVVTAVSLAVLGIVANFVLFGNKLLRSSQWQQPALFSLGIVVLSLLVFAAMGRPWKRWSRTAYW
ncbi:hypothetical protein ACFQJ7_15595 [Halovenus rubra]|uniref:Uncharacterized protein n=2 Tax=Halovenus rubra TaxID=869890 RepID=A0ABD5XC53_9EURY|nr:hypothetical protein [Halovenus rubra]